MKKPLILSTSPLIIPLLTLKMSASLEKFDKIWNPSPSPLLPKYCSTEFWQITGCTDEAVKQKSINQSTKLRHV